MTSLHRTPWLVFALPWPVALLNYLDRQMLASMKFAMMDDIPNVMAREWGQRNNSLNTMHWRPG
jgi:hypothetical protein